MIVLKAAQEKFLGALQAVSGIVERRHTLPILANVLLRKTGKQVEFTTSDLEIQVRTSEELGGDEASLNTTVAARKLIDILRSLPADQVVTLTAAQNKLTLQAGKSRFTLQTLPAEDFPLVNEAVDFGPVFSVPQNTLRSLVNHLARLQARRIRHADGRVPGLLPQLSSRGQDARPVPRPWPEARQLHPATWQLREAWLQGRPPDCAGC